MQESIRRYIEVIGSYVDGRITPNEFENQYMDLYKNDELAVDYPEELALALETLFGAVDTFCGEPDLRSKLPKALDENALLSAARIALKEVQAGVTHSSE